MSIASNALSVAITEDNPWTYQVVYCRSFLGNTALMARLRAEHFDVAIVDMLQNECMQALAVDLGLPVVAFWMSQPMGMEMEGTTVTTRPTHVPYFMTGLPERMNFVQRIQNAVLKVRDTKLPAKL